MKNKFLVIICLLVVSAFISVGQKTKGGLTWYTEILKADKVSKDSGKPIFAFFTGSDWCGWCKKLQADVFTKQSFISWAKQNVILLELDFPRGKQLPQELAQQNASLQQALQVRGYPTVWLMYVSQDKSTGNMNLNTLGSLGYPSGAVKGQEEVKFLEQANEIMKKNKKNP